MISTRQRKCKVMMKVLFVCLSLMVGFYSNESGAVTRDSSKCFTESKLDVLTVLSDYTYLSVFRDSVSQLHSSTSVRVSDVKFQSPSSAGGLFGQYAVILQKRFGGEYAVDSKWESFGTILVQVYFVDGEVKVSSARFLSL
jgi:hypothetical protein